MNSSLIHHDDIYQMLIELHDGHSEAECNKINAKLVLTLIAMMDDSEKIKEAISLVAASSEKWSDDKANGVNKA